MLLFKVKFQLVIILNDTVVHYGNSTQPIKVRVCIFICLVSVSCPSRVPDSNLVVVTSSPFELHTLYAVTTKSFSARKFSCLEHRFIIGIVSDRNNTTRVITARFKDLQSLHTNLPALFLVTQVPNNATAFIFLLGLHHLPVEKRPTGEPRYCPHEHLPLPNRKLYAFYHFLYYRPVSEIY